MASDFRSLSLAPALVEVVGELGWTAPTPIQAQAIPSLLAGEDLVGQSNTGSGKTAAFALPILHRIALDDRGLQALVVCPTRELGAQIAREMRTLGRRHEGLVVTTLTGGEPFARQAAGLARGVHIAIGTPGRLLDHLNRGSLYTEGVRTVVLDEADRMLEMGFLPDVERILGALPPSRQTLLFSATFPEAIVSLSQRLQRAATHVRVGQGDAPQEIRHVAISAEPDEKGPALEGALNNHPHESALVFCNFKASVADVERRLHHAGASVACLHGDLEQFDRDQVLARFRNRSVRILVATDVAGRGIDVEDLDLVINYELPPQPEVYLHRVGRTGRAGKRGLAVSLVTRRDQPRISQLESAAGQSFERLEGVGRVTLPGADYLRPAPMNTILISGGRKDKVRPGDILGALTGEAAGLKSDDIGKIEIQDRISYVAVSRTHSRAAASGLNRGRIKGKRFRATLVGQRRA